MSMIAVPYVGSMREDGVPFVGPLSLHHYAWRFPLGARMRRNVYGEDVIIGLAWEEPTSGECPLRDPLDGPIGEPRWRDTQDDNTPEIEDGGPWDHVDMTDAHVPMTTARERGMTR